MGGSYKEANKDLQRDVFNFLRAMLGGGGFPQYGGQFVAGQTPFQQGVVNDFFGPNGGYNTGMGALTDIAQQDSLGRAQMLLQPSRQRAIEETQRRSRERMSLGNNLLSTNAADAENRAVGNVTGQFDATLANLMPQLEGLRMQALTSLPQFASSGYALGETQRALNQQNLDALYQEYLRTTPSGGPLQNIISLLGGVPLPQQPQQGQRGPSTGQTLLNTIGQFANSPLGAAVVNKWFGGGGGNDAGNSSFGNFTDWWNNNSGTAGF